MTLVRRANSKHWYVQFQLKHQTVIRSTRTTDKRVAERVAAKIRAEAHERIVLGKKKQITLGEPLMSVLMALCSVTVWQRLNRANLTALERQAILMDHLTCAIASVRSRKPAMP